MSVRNLPKQESTMMFGSALVNTLYCGQSLTFMIQG